MDSIKKIQDFLNLHLKQFKQKNKLTPNWFEMIIRNRIIKSGLDKLEMEPVLIQSLFWQFELFLKKVLIIWPDLKLSCCNVLKKC